MLVSNASERGAGAGRAVACREDAGTTSAPRMNSSAHAKAIGRAAEVFGFMSVGEFYRSQWTVRDFVTFS